MSQFLLVLLIVCFQPLLLNKANGEVVNHLATEGQTLWLEPDAFREERNIANQITTANQPLSKLTMGTGFLVDSTRPDDFRTTLVEREVLAFRTVYLGGYISTRAMYDLQNLLAFGQSELWSQPRDSTVNASLACVEGGGYDISVTRVDFKTLEGVMSADSCQVNGLTVNGSAAFEYEDSYWDQDKPRIEFPLKFEFSNLEIIDAESRSFSYSGDLFCDRFYNSQTSAVGSM